MLTDDLKPSKRPRPPAKARNSGAIGPPPPYNRPSHIRTTSLLGKSISVPAAIIDWDAGDGKQASVELQSLLSSADEQGEWLDDQTRLELSQILVKADGLIRERAHDLDATTAARRRLYADTLALRKKHDDFLKRLPSESGYTQHRSDASLSSLSNISMGSCTVSATQSPGLNGDLYTKLPESFQSARRLRSRKISISRNDIALLSDQNSELLDKLQQLETDAAQSDQSGRRALRKLEKEIQTLKTELEKTQLKSIQLEEKMEAEDAVRKRTEHQLRVNELRKKSSQSLETDHAVVDFAPSSCPTASQSDCHPFPKTSPLRSSPSSTPFRNNTSTPTDHAFFDTAQRELTLVSQLLQKIRELESTNDEITEKHTQTTHTLDQLRQDATGIQHLYEYCDQNGLEWDGGDRKRHSPDGEVLRFGSLRKLLSSPNFEEWNHPNIFSSRNMERSRASLKPRGTVVGLFDEAMPSSLPREEDAKRGHTPSSLSPALSTISIVPHSDEYRTLESELGEFEAASAQTEWKDRIRSTGHVGQSRPMTSRSPSLPKLDEIQATGPQTLSSRTTAWVESTPRIQPRTATIQNANREAKKKASPRKKAIYMAMELWLWIQFAVIIIVFLWAVIQRGPRKVLREERRRRELLSG